MRTLAVLITAVAMATGMTDGARAQAAASVAFVDDAGRRIAPAPAAQRVVTLAPSLTDFVVAAGGASRLVGIVDVRVRAQAPQARVVGDHQRLDIERIVGLRPDLVLAWAQQGVARELAQLEALGLRVVYVEPRRLADVPAALARVATLLGRTDQGQSLAQAMQDELSGLERRYARLAPVRVFYQVWPRPLLSVNDQHVIADVIRLCGGRNVFGAMTTLVPEVSREAVVQASPELMFAAPERGTDPDAGPRDAQRAPQDAVFAQWAGLGSVPAVAQGWQYTLPGDDISRQGPRIVHAARALCEAVDEVRVQRASAR